MLSDNIRFYRKQLNLSQEELAEKVGVSRQSISFWETGQTQPTIDNIIALSKIFDVSSDMLLGTCSHAVPQQTAVPENKTVKKLNVLLVIIIGVIIAITIGIVITIILSLCNSTQTSTSANFTQTAEVSDTAENLSPSELSPVTEALTEEPTATPTEAPFDLFTCCKNFAIENGQLNGDYCIYQQPSTMYGGYENEYFSISYWSDSDMVEFSLHCPLSETQSHNFYLRMRGGYHGEYEYVSSKYYRDTGESFRSAYGYIDPLVFSDNYPIPCDEYIGSTDGQTDFMEQSRVGICDLIHCLKEFVTVENIECDFSDFDFVNF